MLRAAAFGLLRRAARGVHAAGVKVANGATVGVLVEPHALALPREFGKAAVACQGNQVRGWGWFVAGWRRKAQCLLFDGNIFKKSGGVQRLEHVPS